MFYCKPVCLNWPQFRDVVDFVDCCDTHLSMYLSVSLGDIGEKPCTSTCKTSNIQHAHHFHPPLQILTPRPLKTFKTLANTRSGTHFAPTEKKSTRLANIFSTVWRVDWEPAVHEFHRRAVFLRNWRIQRGVALDLFKVMFFMFCYP